MPYRIPGRPREPASPDIDENLLRKPWASRALIVSLVYTPFLIWWVVMVEGGTGPRQVSLHAKIAIAVAFALWLVVLLILRARHERVVRAAVVEMEQEATEASRLRISDEPPGARDDVSDDVEREDDSDGPPDARRRG